MRSERPLLLTPGDPDGIGPDLLVPLLREVFHRPLVVVADPSVLPLTLPRVTPADLAQSRGLPPFSLLPVEPRTGLPASYAYLLEALDRLDQGLASSLITGPIDKKQWLDAGVPYKGHTELFQERYNPAAVMFFWSPTLKVALYTIHCPLQTVFDRLSIDGVCAFLDHLIPLLNPLFDRPCAIKLAGLNPHAGEGGIMGDEEETILKPALDILRQRHPNPLSGPFPADSLFYQIRHEDQTVVISWYHDQGLIPFKLLNFHRGVNVTLGLPFLRTSPDHGTAAELKGTDRIDPGSMVAAAHLADDWATRLNR